MPKFNIEVKKTWRGDDVISPIDSFSFEHTKTVDAELTPEVIKALHKDLESENLELFIVRRIKDKSAKVPKVKK